MKFGSAMSRRGIRDLSIIAACISCLGTSCGTTVVAFRYSMKSCPSASSLLPEEIETNKGTLHQGKSDWKLPSCTMFKPYTLKEVDKEGTLDVAAQILRADGACELVIVTHRVGRFGDESGVIEAHTIYANKTAELLSNRVGAIDFPTRKASVIYDGFSLDIEKIENWCRAFPGSLSKLKWR